MNKMRFVFSCLVLLLAIGPVARAEPLSPRKYTLTISGGISLGAYEAGLNWAMVRIIKKHPDELSLAGVSGASAGAFNALATGVAWVEKDDAPVRNLMGHLTPQTVENNLFWNTWIPVGLEQLFPGDASCREYGHRYLQKFGVEPDCRKINRSNPDKSIFPWTAYTEYNDYANYVSRDSLFTRNAFTYATREMERALSSPDNFSPGKSLPVGITLTKSLPGIQKFNGLEIKSQRYVLPMVFREKNGALGIEIQSDNENISGNIILPPLPADGTGDLAPGEVVNYIFASTAFPGAFGPVGLYYCDSTGVPGPAQLPKNRTCAPYGESPPKTMVKAQFLDGGVFDNLPLSLSMEQVSPRDYSAELRHVLINPDSRRAIKPAERRTGEGEADSAGATYLAEFTKGFFNTARNYELYTTYRNLQYSAQPVTVAHSSRFSPITGDYIYNFGAFIDVNFRKYDYYAGVYDGLRALAADLCEAPAPYRAANDCIGARMERFAADIELSRHADAWFVLRMLAMLENRLSPPEGGQSPPPPLSRCEAPASPLAENIFDAERLISTRSEAFLSDVIENGRRNTPHTWRWTALTRREIYGMADSPIGIVMLTLFETELCSKENGDASARSAGIGEFILGLKRNRYPFDPDNSQVQEIKADYDKWRKTMLIKSAERLRQIEERDGNRIGAIAASITGYSMLSLWGAQRRRGWTDEAAIPSRLYREQESNDLIRTLSYLMPYSVDMDVTGNGPAISWNIGSYIINDDYLFRLPVGYQRAERTDKDYFSLGALFTRRISDSLVFSSLAAGPAIFQNALDGPDRTTGFVVQLGLFLDKFRITAGVRDTAGLEVARRGNWDAWFVSFGFYDVRTVFYWMFKGTAPAPPEN